jgi:hypothetical protein
MRWTLRKNRGKYPKKSQTREITIGQHKDLGTTVSMLYYTSIDYDEEGDLATTFFYKSNRQTCWRAHRHTKSVIDSIEMATNDLRSRYLAR